MADPKEPLKPKGADQQTVIEVAKVLKTDPNVVFLINGFLNASRMSQLGKISKKTGAKIKLIFRRSLSPFPLEISFAMLF